MLVLVTLSCVTLAVWVVPAERQRRAVAAIETLGGQVTYASNKAASDSFPIAHLRRWLPKDYFDEVESVNLNDPQVTDDGLAPLQGLTRLQKLWLNYTQITDVGLARLKRLTDLQTLTLDKPRLRTTVSPIWQG